MTLHSRQWFRHLEIAWHRLWVRFWTWRVNRHSAVATKSRLEVEMSDGSDPVRLAKLIDSCLAANYRMKRDGKRAGAHHVRALSIEFDMENWK